MKYEIAQCRHHEEEWRVEAIDMENDGDCYVTTFAGPIAKQRAEEYLKWKNL